MPKNKLGSGMAAINDAKIHYEIAGEGEPFVMIHAGVADRRQWDNEFEYFSNHYRVLRYDMRGYGKSEGSPDEAGVYRVMELHNGLRDD